MKIKNIILFILFLIIATNRDTSVIYIYFFLIIAFTTLHLTLSHNLKFSKKKDRSIIPMVFLFVWLYGLVLGFYNSNDTNFVIANNAGMLMYLTYYVFEYFKFSKKILLNLILICGFYVALVTILFFVLNIILGINESLILNYVLGNFTSGSSTGQDRVYFVSQIALYPAVSFFLGKLISSKRQHNLYFENDQTFFSNFLKFTLFTVCLVFLTASKGFMLGFLVVMLLVPFGIFSKEIISGYINSKLIFFSVLIVLLTLVLVISGYFNIISAIFDNGDSANIIRYEQMVYLIDDLKIFGKGLGAVIPGYSRNDDKPYGFELSFLNLIHKFGIFSILLIIMYVHSMLKALSNVIKGKEVKYGLVSIGCLCFLFPSIGNPVLFAPQAVTLHCIAIYLLKKEDSYV